MIEGEYIIDMWVDMDRLFVKTNLDRVWQSTNTPVDNFDMVEVATKLSKEE
jgi:hypothetical protein